jgi:hypothetical protein
MYYLRITLFSLVFILFHGLCHAQIYPRTDTLYIPQVKVVPVIDGDAGDAAWGLVDWQPIDQIWMPYGNLSANLGQEAGLQLWQGADDFTGKYKVVWSAETNLLYFLAEIVDDVFVDGYVYSENPSQGGGYPNYDILEIFIDEDRSGGLHVFNGTGNVATQWGTNAENAFAYHMAVNAPNDGGVEKSLHAVDITGSNWGYPNQKVADYASHFPEFALHKNGNTYTWEFSLVVHNDKYNPTNEQASIVSLEVGKIMGLSIAYCDNDNPNENPLRRDHFFGSVYVPLSAHNDHWKQANWFGVAKLTAETETSSYDINPEGGFFRAYVSGNELVSEIHSDYQGPVMIRVFDALGKKMNMLSAIKDSDALQMHSPVQQFPAGMYFIEVIQGDNRQTEKFVLSF